MRHTLRTHVFRAHHPRWSHVPASGAGAALHGGRLNRPGVPCLYTSLRMPTAWLEAQQGFAFKAQPVTLCAYDVDCADVLDLSAATGRAGVNASLEELACAWEDLVDRGEEPPSWALADRLRADGVAGVIVPSFAHRAGPDDLNAVFWRWSDAPPHRVAVIDDDARLPRDDRSWT